MNDNRSSVLRILFAGLILWHFSSLGFSQDFIHFTQDNGLPSNKVYMVTLDKNGFIWCATDKGIAMYNGDKFTIYTTHEGLPLNDLWKIYASNDGKIWYLGRSNRLGYIENGKVFSFPTADGSVMNPICVRFYSDSIGFIANEKNYRLENGKWVIDQLSLNEQNTYREIKNENGGVFSYGNFHNNDIISIGNNKFLHFDRKFRIVKEFEVPGVPINTQYYPAVSIVNDSIFYFHIADRVCIYDIKKHFFRIIFLDQYFSKEDMKNMWSFNEDEALMINGPAGKYLLKNDSLVRVIDPIEIPGHEGHGLFRDSLGNTWISTLNHGIFMHPNYNDGVIFFQGENAQQVHHFGGKLYVGIENNGLYEITKNQKKKIETAGHFFYEISNGRDSLLRIITETEFGTIQNGTVTAECIQDEFYAIFLKKFYPFTLRNVKCMMQDTGITYLASSTVFYSLGPNRKICYAHSGVYQIIKYRKRIILGTTTGIKILGDSTIKELYPEPAKINKLFLFKDYLLVGTDGAGLYVYNDTLIRIKGTESFTVNNIESNNDTSLWLSTNLGVHEILYSKGHFRINRSILRSNGLLSNMVNDIAINGDSLYCATENGLCVIGLKGLRLKNDPNIIFSRLVVNDSLFSDVDTIRVNGRNNNSINVGFDIAYLNEHSQLKNFYRIEPIHNDWIPLNSSGFTYNGLKPGEYKVLIKTEGFNGNRNEKSFFLIIQPRWFEKRSVLFVGAIIGIGLMAFCIYLITAGILKRRNRKFLIENQLINLELQALRSKLNPHFIFNTFNAIQLYINSNQLELSEKYLILLSKHIRNVFEFSHLQKIPLEKEINLLRDYLEIEKTRFGDKINIRIYVDDRINTDIRQIPSMIVQPYVENSMVHGLFHKDGVGSLTVDFMYVDEHTYKVRIIDDGIGFIEQESQRISSTKVNRERIDLINQSGEFHITVEKSFMDESKKDKGTIITLTIQDGK